MFQMKVHDGGPDDKLLYSQDGLYGHGLFVLLIPFTWLTWEDVKILWAIINIVISFYNNFVNQKI